MSAIPDILGAGTTLVMFALIVAAVMKLFQVSTEVREMKGVLLEIRRNLQVPASGQPAGQSMGHPSMGLSGTPTPEELVRAVHAQSFGDDFPL
ncbi:MAG TPA: hypothetical protein VGG72_33190 [Bryobacteraceae bacterium]